MDKIFLIDKQEGISSFDVVYKLRKKFNIKKIGHTGTLDPFATGLLILCCGEATKISNYILSSSKTYLATLKLGSKTDTLDKDGKVIEEKPVPKLNEELVTNIFNKFVGDIKQVPPMYSAIKVNGQKMYDLARKGIEIELEARDIHIEYIKLISIENDQITFETKCSKGTYIRTLGSDIAEALGTVGHLTFLRRLSIDNFDVKNAVSVENVIESDGISIKEALNIQAIVCDEKMFFDVKNGKKIKLDSNEPLVLMLDINYNELAIYEKEKDYYKCVRGFNICK